MLSDFVPIDVAGRIDRVRTKLAAQGCDAMVISSRSSIRWCTGFAGSHGIVVVTPDGATVFTDTRYGERALAEVDSAGGCASVEVTPHLVRAGAAMLSESARVGFEAESISWAERDDWAAALNGEPVATRAMVAELRAVKDAAELERMMAAAAIADSALSEAHPLLCAGTTERELASALDNGIRKRGAAGPAYDTIVAGGPNSALPHPSVTTRCFVEGDLVVVDVGAAVDGYRSDMTRTFAVGEPSSRAAEIAAVVTEAQAAGVAAVRAGVEAGSIDEVCRSIITEAGYGREFSHGTGHGVGLDIHELPAIRRANSDILQRGHVITVEPGIYVPGFGGVRIEDSVVVTDTGCTPLTHSPKIPL